MSRRSTPSPDGWGLILPEVIYDFCKKRKYGQDYADYWVQHPFDEALLAYGIIEPAGPPHHIFTRGSGGVDDAWNLISLSRENHELVHKIGVQAFVERFPHLAEKFAVVLDKGVEL
jgi:hypothetical protein